MLARPFNDTRRNISCDGHFIPCLVLVQSREAGNRPNRTEKMLTLVQPRKSGNHSDMTEKLLTGM